MCLLRSAEKWGGCFNHSSKVRDSQHETAAVFPSQSNMMEAGARVLGSVASGHEGNVGGTVLPGKARQHKLLR